MRNFVAIVSAALLLAGCSASGASDPTAGGTSAPTAAANDEVTATASPTASATPSPAPAVTVTVTETAPKLSAVERVFVIGARQYWPNETDPDVDLLDAGREVCSSLDITEDLAETVEYVRFAAMPFGVPVDDAELFAIAAVMSLCPEHDDKLPS